MWSPSARRNRLQKMIVCALVLTVATTTIVIQPTQCNPAQAPSAPPTGLDSSSSSSDKSGPKIEAKAEAQAVREQHPDQQQQQAKQASPEARSSGAPAASAAVGPASSDAQPKQQQSEADQRKGRASEEPASSAETPALAGSKDEKPKESAEKQTSGSSSSSKLAESAKPEEKKSGKQQSQPQLKQQQQLSAKSGASSGSGNKSRLPLNLGTVTSTGSGGPAHYMSKHDAYSAIAEKHGALAQDSVRNTHRVNTDRRSHLQRFGGIQRASGIGDMLSPFKGVTESDLARTLGASMRSIIKGKFSIPAYVASAVLGAVALMAFYESPISPLPVPALPEPPVGRFPPEMPSLSPNTQVPFRMNQQQQYGQQAYANQRSFPGSQMPQQQQQQQQVLFAGNMAAPAAQQRQMTAGGPVQQLAANLLSAVGKQQNAERKSGPDYDPSSRTFFGSQNAHSNQRLSAPANQSQQKGFLSYLGLGSSSGSSGSASGASSSNSGPADVHQASGLGAQVMGALEPKGQSAASGALSNSHVVNKVKSYFSRASSPSSSSSLGTAASNSNPYDQYQKMSFMQALAKDTAFLPAFLNPSRKSSSSPAASSSSSGANKLQQTINNVLSAASGSSGAAPSGQGSPQSMAAASRMQVDSQPQQQASVAPASNKRSSSGYGLVRAADRIAHALLDTLSSGSGLLQRHAPASSSRPGQQAADERKGSGQQQTSLEESPLMSTASLLSDFMLSSYAAGQQQPSMSQQFVNSLAQAAGLQPSGSGASGAEQQSSMANNEEGSNKAPVDQMLARSGDQHQSSAPSSSPAARSADQQLASSSASSQASKTPASGASVSAGSAQPSNGSHSQQEQHVRKTRSVGAEYPTVEYSIANQSQQGPSRAAQINNLVDFVSDSYKQNKMLVNFVMNRVGLSQALPYLDQILGDHQVGVAKHLIQ